MSALVEVEKRGGVATVTMCRAEFGNSMNAQLMRDVLHALQDCALDDDVRAIVVAAEGKVWCAGGDLSELTEGFGELGSNELYYSRGDTGLPPTSKHDQLFDEIGAGHWTLAVRRIEKPMIAAVEGAVAGGGLGFFGLHDYRIGGESATFTPAFIRIGVGPDFGASWFVPRIMGPSAAMRFFLKNEKYTAAEGLDSGLLHEVVPAGTVLDTAVAFAGKLAKLPPLGVRANIRALRSAQDNSLYDQLALEWRNQDVVFNSDDARRALSAFRSKTTATYHGQ